MPGLGLKPCFQARNAILATISEGTIANRPSPKDKIKAEAKPAGLASLLAKPAKNKVAVRKAKKPLRQANPQVSLSAKRPLGTVCAF